MPDRADDFIAALRDEIEAVKKSKAGSIQIVDGTLIGQIADDWVYSYTAPRIIGGEDDSPAVLEVEGRTTNCSLVSTNGL